MNSSAPAGTGTTQGLVYSSSPSGHRGSYVALLASLFRLVPVCEELTPGVLRRLVRAPHLLLATFDDHVFSFALVALLRGLLGRPTAALVLRPQGCFDGRFLKSGLRRRAFLLIRRIPRLTLVTVTPFSVEPRYATVAHFGAHDPQYWDLHDGTQVHTPAMTPFAEEIRRHAAGRRIVCMPGALILLRGFGFLAEILRKHPSLREQVLVVAAGILRPEAGAASRLFAEAGGMLIDRRLEDAELESLYLVSDAIWSCYAPEYDQASGIFGRAVQLGVPVIVRRGSLIERFAADLDSPVLALEYGNVAQGAEILAMDPPARLSGAALAGHAELVGAWRENFVRSVTRALEPAT